MSGMIVVCCWCQRQRINGLFVAAPPDGYPGDADISHTYCDDCLEEHYSVEAIAKAEAEAQEQGENS
jgi:hypothetical protein